eukprot:3875953-Pyramimonas_sp.AAC.1
MKSDIGAGTSVRNDCLAFAIFALMFPMMMRACGAWATCRLPGSLTLRPQAPESSSIRLALGPGCFL